MVVVDSHRDSVRAQKLIADKGWTGKFLENGEGADEFVYRTYGINGFPTTYLLDRTGRIYYLHYGFREGNEKQIEEHVQKLLSLPKE